MIQVSRNEDTKLVFWDDKNQQAIIYPISAVVWYGIPINIEGDDYSYIGVATDQTIAVGLHNEDIELI